MANLFRLMGEARLLADRKILREEKKLHREGCANPWPIEGASAEGEAADEDTEDVAGAEGDEDDGEMEEDDDDDDETWLEERVEAITKLQTSVSKGSEREKGARRAFIDLWMLGILWVAHLSLWRCFFP